jgi:hypothetical protein
MPDFNQVADKPRIIIASPALAQQNNGNWQTASRWAAFLGDAYVVDIVPQWQAGDPAPDLLIALHARRSAPSLAAFTQAWPRRPSILVLTGTDLYRDIAIDTDARAALVQASALVLLQPAGRAYLPEHVRAKAHVIYQSADSTPPPATRTRDVTMVGHLRDEKDPLTFMRAARSVTRWSTSAARLSQRLKRRHGPPRRRMPTTAGSAPCPAPKLEPAWPPATSW